MLRAAKGQCCHRVAVGAKGAPPFSPLQSVPYAPLDYEELEVLPTMSAKLAFVQSRVRNASHASLTQFASNGRTAAAYPQQDTTHSFGSSVTNFAEVKAWYTTERRRSMCTAIAKGCLIGTPWDSGRARAWAMEWCTSTPTLRLPSADG